MASDRRKHVMSVELAMQREMAYRKRLESVQLNQGTESRKNPGPQNQTSLPASNCDPAPTRASSTPSSCPKLRPRPSSTSTQKLSPISSPNPDPRSTQQQPQINVNQHPVPSPSPLPPRSPSLPLKRKSSLPGRTASPILSTRPSYPSGPDPASRRPQPIPSPKPKLGPVLSSPWRPHTPPGTGFVPRPKLSSPLGLTAGPKPSARPSLPLLSRPSEDPSRKRKEAPDQQVQPHYGGKISRLCCEVCDVNCTSAANLQMHLEGQKHQAKVKQGLLRKGNKAAKIEANNGPQLRCELCEVWCMDEFNFKQHLSGKNHFRKLQAVQNMV